MTILCKEPIFPPGTIICGKWNGKEYAVERLLGEGANGRVYLVHHHHQLFALKMGFQVLDHQLEVNALRALQKEQSPFLYESDDLTWNGKDYPFYVMKYVEGDRPELFLKNHGFDCFSVIGYQLLRQLHQIHQSGYVFGDLKPENILVSRYGVVNLIDFGGLTEKDNAVRQYTEFYDRGYWGGGGRKADEAYDLFSFCVLGLQLANPEGLAALSDSPHQRNPRQLLKLAHETASLRKWYAFFEQVLTGRLTSSSQAVWNWKEQMHRSSHPVPVIQTEHLVKLFILTLILFASTLIFVIK